MDLDQILPTFFAECRDLLDDMENNLLNIELLEDKSESLNAIFRAAHTIKGSAGLFSFEQVVSFTHVVEEVLDKLREGKNEISPALIALLLECGDHINQLVNYLERGEEPSDVLCQAGTVLISQLHPYYIPSSLTLAKSHLEEAPTKLERIPAGYTVSDNWHISLRFSSDILSSGMDPIAMLRYLETLGEIVSINTLDNMLPPSCDMDPECCYLGFEISFKSTATKHNIENVFEFVRQGSKILILPPHSLLADFISLINSTPEQDFRLGEILVAVGSLTQGELNDALQQQQELQTDSIETLLGNLLVERGMTAQPVLNAAIEKQNQVRDSKFRETTTVRVDAEKLDQLINLVGELVTASAGTAINAYATKNAQLLESISTLVGLVEDVRDSALRLRMVQIGATFSRFQRVVHDMSKELGKNIELVITGAETELDKTVVEKIGDPLMHLVRNSIDHGIESSEAREALGKPAVGKLKLNAYHDSGYIVIEVADDGAGLNKEQIHHKAIEKGLIQANQQLDDQELYNLIFEPGFSTANTVTNISGRGVGMDVVKRNIADLRGSIELDSKPGQGTKFKVRLPLTLAIINGFLIGVGDSAFVVPLDMVFECIELNGISGSDNTEQGYINLRGEVLPLIKLRELFDIEGNTGKRQNIVVVQYAGNKAGIVVDQLMGEFQTVIKPLGKIFSHVQAVSGFTVLGSGKVALIIDVPGLIHKITSKRSSFTPTAA